LQPNIKDFEAHAFDHDSATLDVATVRHLQTFYTFSDSKDHPKEWAACFTDDAVMQKATRDVKTREGKINRHDKTFLSQIDADSHL
jgi:hypothetical protein